MLLCQAVKYGYPVVVRHAKEILVFVTRFDDTLPDDEEYNLTTMFRHRTAEIHR